ncbi:hypothetical protein HanRHA438_Chr08g0338761 [Helianthus annuus]|uniref:Uncharacterized protein n=1 Tax=Helianthus annuus TaxID=4232 RepID=A0A251U4N8_HELAN|nr:hypothetical protein HanXRQr2_Chr08g0327571 [Helianthus annuus]KAJ0538071.1 hypothetical protein HanHA300_Chr08g0270811 [Helianthus annuus]KAJ0552666.1 hypothetical protein HanHA89_Chr08g0287721 [Helianthus annuus]KAJ0721596.1 hypothetical protein HanOQP8_Chr08g0277271 [Helianthus annuus]KAJ0896813.1 hypothetical protein HanRHA438_Chr08g0338761 [Helianthus annuus]
MVVVQAQGQRRLRVRVSIGNDQSVIDDGVSPNSDDKPTKMSYDAGSGYSDGGDFRYELRSREIPATPFYIQLQKVLNLYLVASGFQNKSAPAIKKLSEAAFP